MNVNRDRAGIVAAFGAGAVTEYFLDPQAGTRRRHVARDRGVALIRRPVRRTLAEARRRASYTAGIVRGIAHEATARGGARDPERLNDAGLAAKIRSEVFRAPDAPKGAVSVNVEAGIAYLRGELPSDASIRGLIERVAAVEGVHSVRSLLHVGRAPVGLQ